AIKKKEALRRRFERFLIRLKLEEHPASLAAFLNSDRAQALPVENRLLASLALEPKASASQVAKLLPRLSRPPGDEELLRLVQFPDEPGVGETLKQMLENPATTTA